MNVIYIFYLLINIILESLGLEVYESAVDNNIVETASAIRNVTNEIFLALKLKGVKHNVKLKQYSLIHNYFNTITVKDQTTLYLVRKASRFNTTNNNGTIGLVDVVNDLIKEDSNKTIEESNKDNLNAYVDEFLTKLEYLKDSNGVNDNKHDINNQLIDILSEDVNNNGTRHVDSGETDSFQSENEFWVPEEMSGRRIYKGKTTKAKKFPFMASVQIFNSFQCGGSIIHSDLVITAASCVQLAWNNRFFRENPSFLSVRIGSDFYKGGGESIAVLEVYFHPGYDPKTLKDNICLLRLIRKIKFTKRSKVKKIDFDRHASSLPINTDGVTVVGWGARGTSNLVQNPWKNRLSFAVLDIYPLQECQDVYSKKYVTKKHFCAGFFSKGSGACNGDVGGPGVVHGVLAGVVSFGSPVCGTPDAPTVFTKLGYYTDWIEGIMEQDVPNTRKRTTLQNTPPPLTMPKHNTLEPTTFILEPVDADWKPPFVNAAPVTPTSLRLLEDENLFKEFLSTVFGSKEADEYAELFETTTEKEIKRHKKIKSSAKLRKPESPRLESHQDDLTELGTKFFEDTTPQYKFTALDDTRVEDESKEAPSDVEIEEKILKLIENIDISDKQNMQETKKINTERPTMNIKDLLDRDVLDLLLNSDDTSQKQDANANVFQKNTFEVNANTMLREKEIEKDLPANNSLELLLDGEDVRKTENDIDDNTILTLLYLSDNDTDSDPLAAISEVIDKFDENVDGGLSIDVEGFKDLTYRNNDTETAYNLLPKDEIYDLLVEAIDDVAKNKELNT